MNGRNRASLSHPEDRFAEAVARLEAGESIAEILATYPLDQHEELGAMLAIVETARATRRMPVPRPSAARRAAAKRTFLATAAALRAEQMAAAPMTPPRRPTTLRSIERRTAPPQSLLERFVARWQSIFSVRTLRLAPVIVTLALVLFSTGTLVTMAQTAVPGDLAYTLKQWIRRQELVLTPANQRDMVRQAQERELAADVARAASRADANSAVIQAEDTQIYYSRNGRILKIGDLSVMDRYQPDANVEVFREMTIEGDLQPGAQVKLAYQIMPGQDAYVQGIALTVVAPPSPEMLEIVGPTETPTVAGCTVTQPEGWVPYAVAEGDNLTYIANRGGTTVAKIMEVNCLESDVLVTGTRLYVPADALKLDRSQAQCTAELPAGWVPDTVQLGDNLTAIAERTGVSVAEIQAANCLDTEVIQIGAQLYVPVGQ
jgi:LysM repeat protein